MRQGISTARRHHRHGGVCFSLRVACSMAVSPGIRETTGRCKYTARQKLGYAANFAAGDFGTDMPRRELSLTVRASPVGLAGRCSACLLPTCSRYYAKPTRPEINDIPERHELQGKQVCTTVTERCGTKGWECSALSAVVELARRFIGSRDSGTASALILDGIDVPFGGLLPTGRHLVRKRCKWLKKQFRTSF